MKSEITRKPRARDLGVPFDGNPGTYNAITDIKGVAVGHLTIIEGEGKLIPGKGPIRTGVTAIVPSKETPNRRLFAAWFPLNGNGEMTGTTWMEESGLLEGPILLTNTHSVGTVRDAVIEWQLKKGNTAQNWLTPVVAETYDGFLNDINGFHVRKEHVFEALESAKSGPVPEGNVGGGTGMICYDFKGGIGTSSRRLEIDETDYMVGVLVQANHGMREQLLINGVPVGAEIPGNVVRAAEDGSIIIIVATDAPFLPHQLKRMARRAALGLARTGANASNFSGDIVLAFSTANPEGGKQSGLAELTMLPNDQMDPFFQATIQATEEAIINALVAAETMTGIDNYKVVAMPHNRLQQIMQKYASLWR